MPDENQSDDEDVFAIPWRPKRITHDDQPVRDEDGEPVTDENGEELVAGGGSAIEGYTKFTLTADDHDHDAVNEIVVSADEWGAYATATWEPYNHLLFDTEHSSAFEVRIFDDRVMIDVKANTTSESIREFVSALRERSDVDWTVDRDAEKLTPGDPS